MSLIAHNTIQNMYIDAMNPNANTVPPINSKANRSLYGIVFHNCFIMLAPFRADDSDIYKYNGPVHWIA